MTDAPLRSLPNEFWSQFAKNEIAKTYNDRVSIQRKAKGLLKFGGNALVGTSQATLMTLPSGVLAETYVSTNIITQVSSSSTSDTGEVMIEGHTISGGVFTFVVQSATLNGRTAVVLTTPLARVSRLYNTGASNFAGNIYVAETDTLTNGVPDTGAKVHLIADAAENQSLKCATTFSDADYFLLGSIHASIEEKTAAGAVIRLKVRNAGGVFRTILRRGINSVGASLDKTYRPFLIVPPNSDLLMTAEADGASTPISGEFDGILAKKIAE